MLSAANTTLDLLVLELILNTTLFATCLLGLLCLHLPVYTGSENDVLTDGRGVERRTRGVALLQTEFGPRPSLRDLWVDMFSHNCRLDSAGDLYFLAFVIETVGDDGFRSVFVRYDLLRGECGGFIELLVVGPVGAARREKSFRWVSSLVAKSMGNAYLTDLDMLTVAVVWGMLQLNFWISVSKLRIRCGFVSRRRRPVAYVVAGESRDTKQRTTSILLSRSIHVYSSVDYAQVFISCYGDGILINIPKG